MPKKLTTCIERRDNSLWVTFPDSVDMDNYSTVERRIEAELDESPCDLVIDFSKTKSLFSSGIGVLVRLKKKTDTIGKALALVNTSDKLREGFTNVGLDRTLQIFATAEEYEKSRT